MTALGSLLGERRDAIVDRWMDLVLPVDAANPFPTVRRQKDQFANPVWHKLFTGGRAILDVLIEGRDLSELSDPIDGIIRIRSVQDIPPSKAVSVIFLLKRAIHDEIRGALSDKKLATELLELDGRIDELALSAFDVFMKCREKLYEIRANEAKRSVSGLLRRAERLSRQLESVAGKQGSST